MTITTGSIMAKTPEAHDDADAHQKQPRNKRRPRRATAAGTGPTSADGTEPRLDDVLPKAKQLKKTPLSARDRWMLGEKPPHY